MPRIIEVPRIHVGESLRAVLREDFPRIGELPIRGGWGYSRQDAIIIDRNDPLVARDQPFDGVGLEYLIVEKRIYEELIIFRPDASRYSGIEWTLLRQELHSGDGRHFDMLQFEVTALPDAHFNRLKCEWEAQNNGTSPGFDVASHLHDRDEQSIAYHGVYWFDITSFHP